MNEPVFVLRDIKQSVIKKDDLGMLCIFDTDRDAKLYRDMLYGADRDSCHIVERSMTMTLGPNAIV